MHAIIYYTTPFSSINLLLYNIFYKTLNEKKKSVLVSFSFFHSRTQPFLAVLKFNALLPVQIAYRRHVTHLNKWKV